MADHFNLNILIVDRQNVYYKMNSKQKQFGQIVDISILSNEELIKNVKQPDLLSQLKEVGHWAPAKI